MNGYIEIKKDQVFALKEEIDRVLDECKEILVHNSVVFHMKAISDIKRENKRKYRTFIKQGDEMILREFIKGNIKCNIKHQYEDEDPIPEMYNSSLVRNVKDLRNMLSSEQHNYLIPTSCYNSLNSLKTHLRDFFDKLPTNNEQYLAVKQICIDILG